MKKFLFLFSLLFMMISCKAQDSVKQVNDKGNFIELRFYHGATSSFSNRVEIAKTAIKIRRKANTVFIYDNTQSSFYVANSEVVQYPLYYSFLSNPVAPSADSLVSLLSGYGGSGSGGGGDASAANQVIGNSSLNSLYTNEYYVKGNEVFGGIYPLTDTVTYQIVGAQGSGKYFYMTNLLVTNAGTVGTAVTFSTGLAINDLYTGYAAPNGGGFVVSFPTPLKFYQSNTAVKVKCGTAGASIYVSCNGFKGN
jgi:hypothetical protein